MLKEKMRRSLVFFMGCLMGMSSLVLGAPLSSPGENRDSPLVVATRYLQEGQIDKAQGLLEDFIQKQPENLGAHYTLALIYEKKNLKEEAIHTWKKFAELSQVQAKKHIEHLKEGP